VAWPPRKRFLLGVDKVAQRFGVQRIEVVPGNHEDWGRLTQLWSHAKNRSDDGAPLPLQVSEVVSILPRGHRWSLEGRSLVALGGAPSLDFANRTLGKSWWPEEMIEPEDVARTVAGGYADIMICHDSPDERFATPPVVDILGSNPFGWPDRALAYAKVGRDRVTEAFLGVAPRLFVHGHFHVGGQRSVRLPGRDYDTRLWSLNANGHAGNLRLLDLATLDDPRA
jgi:hypothetical protein